MIMFNKAISWLSRIFEDQDGSPSSKRVFLIFLSALLYMQVKNNISDVNYFWGILVLSALCVGVITAEFVIKVLEMSSRKNNNINGKEDSTNDK